MNKNSQIMLIVTCLDSMYTLLLLQEVVLDGWRRLWSSIQGWEGEHEWIKPHHISRWHRTARSYYHRPKHEASLFQCSVPKFCKFCFVILCILGAICCFMSSLCEMNTQEWNCFWPTAVISEIPGEISLTFSINSQWMYKWLLY